MQSLPSRTFCQHGARMHPPGSACPAQACLFSTPWRKNSLPRRSGRVPGQHTTPLAVQGALHCISRSSSCTRTSCTTVSGQATAAAGTSNQSHRSDQLSPGDVFDVVVIGAGIGGLSCAALLAFYGLKVVVCESHSVPGGAAHCWSRRGCHFDSGTALFFGLPAAATPPGACSSGAQVAASIASDTQSDMSSRLASPTSIHGSSDNPLAAVLELLHEPLHLVDYGPDRTCLVFPEGTFNAQIGSQLFPDVVQQLWGSRARQEWLELQQLCRDLAAAAVALHPMVVRYDRWVALTAAARRPARFLRYITAKPQLLEDHVMFSDIVDSVVSCPALRQFLDVLCQGTSGAPAAALPAAYMVRAVAEMYQPGTQLQWPLGGPQAIADALVRGIRKHGGKLVLNRHVATVLQGKAGRAAGVKLKDGPTIHARKAVVSNASVWDTQRLLPAGVVLPRFQQQVSCTTPSDSFVHLHAVVDLPANTVASQLPVHTYFLAPHLVGDTGWPTLTLATAVDGTLAPPGKQVLHAYMAEPYGHWQGLARGSRQYQELKTQRAELLWGLIDQVVPWARDHLDWQMVGTPLTHQHFRRRHMGAYGPKVMTNQPTASSLVSEGDQGTTSAPQAVQPMRGMYCCGDCTFPWIGTPAVAASGMWVANTLAPVWKHWAAANAVDH